MLAQQADGRYVVRSRYVRGLTTGVLLFFCFLDAGGVIDATNTAALVFASVIEIALAASVVRAWRSATMIVGDTEVVVRSLLTTRSWPRDKVRAFIASTRAVGMGGWRRRVLGIVFVDGSTRWLTEINSRPPRHGAPTWIDEAVSALNEREGR